MKKMIGTFAALLMGIAVLIGIASEDAQAQERKIYVYYEGEAVIFEDVEPVIVQARTLVPFRKIFETLGFEIEWIDGNVRKVIGKKEGLTIELTINSTQAIVNGNPVELDVPAQIKQGRTLVPLRFISENSGYHVYFADQSGDFIIGIGHTEESANPGVVDQPAPKPAPSPKPVTDSVSPEAYTAKGRVVNAQGQPVAGVEVYADNTLLYNSNILGVTDQKGNYVLKLPDVNTSYRMGARYEIEYNGTKSNFYMEAEPNHAFAASEGAVRNFVLDINKGEVELYSWDSFYPEDENAPWLDMLDVEITLKPVGQLVDGSTGRTITALPINSDGPRVMEIPVGNYEVTAVWKPKGYKAVPLLVSLRHDEDYQEKISISFENPFGDHYRAPISVAFP